MNYPLCGLLGPAPTLPISVLSSLASLTSRANHHIPSIFHKRIWWTEPRICIWAVKIWSVNKRFQSWLLSWNCNFLVNFVATVLSAVFDPWPLAEILSLQWQPEAVKFRRWWFNRSIWFSDIYKIDHGYKYGSMRISLTGSKDISLVICLLIFLFSEEYSDLPAKCFSLHLRFSRDIGYCFKLIFSSNMCYMITNFKLLKISLQLLLY